jgi:hypothetical protein
MGFFINGSLIFFIALSKFYVGHLGVKITGLQRWAVTFNSPRAGKGQKVKKLVHIFTAQCTWWAAKIKKTVVYVLHWWSKFCTANTISVFYAKAHTREEQSTSI